jgi:hypothetical protein
MNKQFAITVKFTKQLENGTFKRVRETFLFSAMTYTDAEARVYEELGSVIRGEFAIVGVVPKPFADIFDNEADTYWELTVRIQSDNLESDKVRFVNARYLSSGDTIKEAIELFEESMKPVLSDFTIIGISQSKILGIYPYVENLDKEISRTPLDSEESNVEEVEDEIEETSPY